MTRILIQPNTFCCSEYLKWFVYLYHFSLARTESESCSSAGHSFTATHAASLNIQTAYIYLSFIFSCNLNQSIRLLCFVLSIYRAQRPYHQSIRLLCFVISYVWTHLHLNFRASNNCVSCGFKNGSGIPNRKTESRTTKNANISKRFYFPQKLCLFYTKDDASFL
jgi:hypothetical protein